MPDVSPRLDLPYLLPAQSQKHVTHNEALRLLDGITQLAVKSFDATTPPGAPASGEMYALGLSPTGAWAGQDSKLALWSENVWMFLTPGEGWLAWGEAEAKLQVYTGGDWQGLAADLGSPDSLGINTTADLVNRLAVASDASLFTNDGSGHQLKINKAASGDTASLLYQSNWSGRAEIGLMGDDNFQFKVSPDGSSWMNAITLDKDNGRMAIAGLSGRLPVYDTGGSVFIGDGAGVNDDLTDNRNVFVGKNAGNSNTTGNNNVANGYQALSSNTTGGGNVAYGYQALFLNTTGSDNVANGFRALISNTTGSFNVAFGPYALYNNTTGSHNIAVGRQTLYSNTTGIQNTGNGYQTLNLNTSGSFNSAYGYATLRNNTTGSQNTATGRNTLNSNTTGSYNTASGYEALFSNTTGNFNTACGRIALRQNTTGSSNTASGHHALYSNTSGNNNVASGYRTLYDVTDGANNTAFGHDTGRGITTGDNNTILGANVTGLASDLQSTVILADGAGNQRLSFDSAGLMDYKQTPDAATANPTFSHYLTLKLNGATYYIPAHNATF